MSFNRDYQRSCSQMKNLPYGGSFSKQEKYAWEDAEFDSRYKIFRDELDHKFHKYKLKPENYPDFHYYYKMYMKNHKHTGRIFHNYWCEKMDLKYDDEKHDGKIRIWNEVKDYVREQMKKGRYNMQGNRITTRSDNRSCMPNSFKRKSEFEENGNKRCSLQATSEILEKHSSIVQIDLTRESKSSESCCSSKDVKSISDFNASSSSDNVVRVPSLSFFAVFNILLFLFRKSIAFSMSFISNFQKED
jgi:hypothetical protein